MSSRIKVFFDGGCRPNPGSMEIAVVVFGRTFIRCDLGYGTSEDAEWLALIEALRIAQTLGTPDFVLMGDAASVIGPANGTVKCRGSAARHLQTLRDLSVASPRPRIRCVKRSHNLAGIALARLHCR
jgi:ribonuclease HI